jgi:hypothetical protein
MASVREGQGQHAAGLKLRRCEALSTQAIGARQQVGTTVAQQSQRFLGELRQGPPKDSTAHLDRGLCCRLPKRAVRRFRKLGGFDCKDRAMHHEFSQPGIRFDERPGKKPSLIAVKRRHRFAHKLIDVR